MATKPIALISPAKINLFLIVTGKRPDGYHELVTLMCPITLTDTVTVKLMRREITVTCADPNVPEDETNLAHQAARLFLTRWTKEKKGRLFGAHITIEKRIPVAAGLGGGSSNAATVLLALNRVQGKPYTRQELGTMSLTLGADVPFFIFQRPAIATGIGEALQSVTGVLNDYTIILVHPPIRISTASVYQNLNLRLTKCQQRLKIPNLRIKDAFAHIQPGEIAKYLCNDLETVTTNRYPAVEEIKQMLLSLGANGALMSGSGPTVFGLFKDKMVARSVFRHLVKKVSWNVFQVECWSRKNKRVT